MRVLLKFETVGMDINNECFEVLYGLVENVCLVVS